MAVLLLVSTTSLAQDAKPVDAAAAFGARPSVLHIALSPDGSRLAYVGAEPGSGSVLYTVDLTQSSEPKVALYSDGKPESIERCNWISNQRLACRIGQMSKADKYLLHVTRWVALDRDGSALKLLSNRPEPKSIGYAAWGGEVIDWLPEEDGNVLMIRSYLPVGAAGLYFGIGPVGSGVDHIDTRSLLTTVVEQPDNTVFTYLTDGHGTVRVKGVEELKRSAGGQTGMLNYQYRKAGSKEWLKLSDYNSKDYTGFQAVSVNREADLAYGYKLLDGRSAIYSVALNDTLSEKLVCSRPDVDISGMMTVGRSNRVVGAYYFTDVLRSVYIDPEYQRIADMLTHALPGTPAINLVDSSADGNKLLVSAVSTNDPGHYYLFDKTTRQLRPLLSARMSLQGYKFSDVRPVEYRATDSSKTSGYLTTPAGEEHAHGQPAIVLLRSNLTAGEIWGANWLAQYYAARGYVVLQPNIRGTAGFGDRSPEHSMYKSWRDSVDDALDAGRWLVDQGLADPARLFVVGWGFGGYVALQSAVVDPGYFKAVVAIGPITDLSFLKDEWYGWSNSGLVDSYIGFGRDVIEASPARNAARIKVPVLLFHGALNRGPSIKQSRRMADALQSAGVKHELITFENAAEGIDDSNDRAELLRKSDDFLRQAVGMAH